MTRPLLLLAAASLVACADAGSPAGPARLASLPSPTADLSTQVVPNEYIVVLDDRGPGRPDVVTAAHDAELRGATVTARWNTALHGYAVRATATTIQALRTDPRVRYVEANGRRTISNVSSWGLDRIDQVSLPLNGSYSAPNGGAGVHVYIVDTGVLASHSEFTGRVGNGFDAITPGGSAADCHGHGTHVAGTAAGTQYGVARLATIHPVRVMDCSGNGSDAQVITAINWVAANRVAPAVANMSFGGPYSASINQATTALVAAGVTTVVASGNGRHDSCTESPASTPSAITVNALNVLGNHAYFSNFGPCTDIYAPGVNILSSWIGSNTATVVNTGTSMASPHVTGAAALYLSTNPGATPSQVTSALLGLAASGQVGGLPANTPGKLVNVQGIAAAPPTNKAPVANFTIACTQAPAPRKCTLDASTSTDDAGFGNLTFAWSNAVGRPAKTGTTATYQRAVSGYPNTFQVTLTATDAGGLSHAITKTVTIT